jgi:hypothetical protein
VVGNFFTAMNMPYQPPPIFWMVSELMEWPAVSFFTLFNKDKANYERLGENMSFLELPGIVSSKFFLTNGDKFCPNQILPTS